MASTWVSDQINTVQSGFLGGTATAGVAGGPLQDRAMEVRGIIKVTRFTINFAALNPIAGQPVVAIATGDTFVLAWMDPIQRIFFGRIYFTAWGAGATLSIGKLDKNNAANTDAIHYKAATSIAAAGNFDLDGNLAPVTNMTEQVGADPLGDQTAGNLLPQFGSDKVWLTGTLGGTTPVSGTLAGYVLLTEEGN